MDTSASTSPNPAAGNCSAADHISFGVQMPQMVCLLVFIINSFMPIKTRLNIKI